MRIFIITVVAILSAVSAVSAQEFSKGEIAWGKHAQACIDTKHAQSGCNVVIHEDTKRLTIWCPKTAGANIQTTCSAEANASTRPAKWTPPQ